MLATTAAILVSLLFLLPDAFSETPVNWSSTLFNTFAAFIVVLLTLYFFYYATVSKRLNHLAEKIRQRVAASEVPRTYSQLEDDDGLTRLEERVDQLIEVRERELRHFENLDSYRKEYLGNVSHELKTPVFNIQGYIDSLLNGGLDDKAVNTEFLKKAESGIDRLIAIIDDLETITQLESGGLQLDMDSFDIAALVKDVYAGMDQTAAKKSITLALDKKYDKPMIVIADKFRIRQVLVNLVGNSLKYGRENGTTTVIIRYLNDEILVTVADNGPGIEPQHLSRVFERFYRVDRGRSREQGGTGLGLAIVKHIIEAHNKSIEAESSPGKGTRFTFTLTAVP